MVDETVKNRLIREQFFASLSMSDSADIADTLPEAYRHLFTPMMQIPAAICIVLGPAHTFALSNLLCCALVGKPSSDLLGKTMREVLPELENPTIFRLLDNVYQTGEACTANDVLVRWDRHNRGVMDDAWLNVVYQPIYDDQGQVDGIFVCAMDVTEHVRERQALECRNAEIIRSNAALEARVAELDQRRVLLQAILDHTPATIFVKDLTGRYLLANRQLCNTIGRDDIIGHTDDEITPMPYAQQLQETDRQVIAANCPLEREELLCQDDGLHTYLSLKFPLYDVQGEIYAVGGVATDITERKRVEDSLRLSEERFRMLWETANDAMSLSGPDGTVLSANSAYFDLYGYTPAEVINQPFNIIFPEEQRSWAMQAYRSIFQSPVATQRVESIVRRADGSERIVESHASFLVQHGQRIAMLSIVHDITERKRMEEALRASRALLRAVVDNAPALIFAKDLEGRIILVNRNLSAGLQLTPEQMVGQLDTEFAAVEIIASSRSLDQQVITTGQPLMDEEVILYGGEVRTYLAYKFPIYDAYGNIFAIGGISTDITERKRIEEALRLSEARIRLILQNSDIAVFAHDRNLRYTWVDTLLHGYTLDALLGKTDADCFASEDATRLMAIKRQVLQEDVGTRTEVTLQLPSGKTTYDLRLEPLRDVTGASIGIAGAAINITERKQAEQERAELLVREQTARKAAEQAVERTARLQSVTAALSEALTPLQVINVMLEQGIAALEAHAGLVVLRTESATALRVAQARGYPPEILKLWEYIPLNAQVPLAIAVQTGKSVWIDSPDQLAVYYPTLLPLQQTFALVAVPLLVHGRAIGAVGMSFDQARRFTVEEQTFIEILVQQCAQALERARLYTEALRLEAQSRQHAERMQVLADVARAFTTAGLNIQSALEYATSRLAEVIGDCCLICLVSDDGQWLNIVALSQSNPETGALMRRLHTHHRLPVNDSLIMQVVQTGQPVLLASIKQAALHKALLLDHSLEDSDPHSLLFVPMLIRERVIGILGLYRLTPAHPYTQEDQLFVQELANRATLAVDASHLYAAEQQSRERISRLHEVTAALVNALTPAQVAEVIATTGVLSVGAQAGGMVVLSSDGSLVEVVKVVGQVPEIGEHAHNFPADETCPLADVVRTCAPVLIESREAYVSRYPNLVDRNATAGYEAYAALPLVREGRVLGALSFQFTSRRTFGEEDRAFMLTLAQQSAQALERSRLYEAEQQARSEAEQAVQLRNRVFSLVSHDLLNPITAIMGYTHLLQRHLSAHANLDADRLMRGVAQIDAATRQIVSQIQELRDVARLQSNRPLDLLIAPLDLVALVQRTVESYEHLSGLHRICLDISTPSLTLLGDEARLERVLSNLLMNAMKYSPQGGTITVVLKPQEREEQCGAVLSVRDEGIGIPAADLPFLFTPFRRGSNVVGKIEGTGLGLARARQIIEQHSGSIEVVSTEGHGSTFTIWMPLAEDSDTNHTL